MPKLVLFPPAFFFMGGLPGLLAKVPGAGGRTAKWRSKDLHHTLTQVQATKVRTRPGNLKMCLLDFHAFRVGGPKGAFGSNVREAATLT